MKSRFSKVLLCLSLTALLGACVSPRVVQDLKRRNERCEVDNATLKTENEKLAAHNLEMTRELDELRTRGKALERDTLLLGTSLSKLTKNYDKINEQYELLLQKNRELLAGNVSESNKLMQKLQMTEEDLQRREDDLKATERALERKKEDLEKLRGELQEREARVQELENALREQAEAVKALKDKIADALYSYRNEGINVEIKNGKVYVTLEAEVLFATGSYAVDQKGKQALIKLAKVLEKQRDVTVMVEGHTDTDKYKGGGPIRDNWELSVLRALSVVRILTENSRIDPKQIISAGRGEYMPVDARNTEEAKRKNRRIEIILAPRLDELFQIMETH